MSDRSSASNPVLQDYLHRADEALRRNDFAGAVSVSNEAVVQGLSHPKLLTLAAYHQIGLGFADLALGFALRACEQDPRSSDALQAQARALAELGRHQEALPIYDRALALAPAAVNVRFHRALTLEALNEAAQARAEYGRIVEAVPHPGALGRLAEHAALRGEAAAARSYAQRALQYEPRQSSALLALAQCELHDGNLEGVLSHASPLTSEQNSNAVACAVAHGVIADALDEKGRYSEAFAHYISSNEFFRGYFSPQYAIEGNETARAFVDRINGALLSTSDDDWRNCAAGNYKPPVKTHAFLVGFPRSGTTLLENILAGHRDVEALEESDCLRQAASAFLGRADGLQKLASLEGDALAQYRDAYWREASRRGARFNHTVFIDKMPLYSRNLCLIAKLFPDAKILFAIRDPRDVVLSCFRRRFAMSLPIFELLTLEGAAGYYDAVMRLCETYRQKLSLQILDVVYEDVVRDMEGEVEKAVKFLQLEHDPATRDFAQAARVRNIGTPSALQVVRDIYGEGAGQWRNYKDQMAPVLPILAPWVARFGYPAE